MTTTGTSREPDKSNLYLLNLFLFIVILSSHLRRNSSLQFTLLGEPVLNIFHFLNICIPAKILASQRFELCGNNGTELCSIQT
jgi:hypothetical protein